MSPTFVVLNCATACRRLFANMLLVASELGGRCCRATFYLLIALVILIGLGGGTQVVLLATGGRDRVEAQAQQVVQDLGSSNDVATLSSPPTLVKAAANSSLLYECEISYLQMDMSLIKFEINYLELSKQNGDGDENRAPSFTLPSINYESQPSQLRALTKLNASQPFVFFINGFNTFGPTDEINATWMYDVAKSFASRPGESRVASPRRNVIFLTWSIPNLFASNLLSMIPAYYKTVANYDLIMDCVTRTLAKLIAFADTTRRFETPARRLDYFRSWHFYGHSLGSHILSDAISRVVDQSSSSSALTPAPSLTGANKTGGELARLQPLKFGKLVGLDPATPCFVSREYGISSAKVARAVHEVLVLHSNAGFAGVPNERANLEIVLNGGTFQPGCSWYDFTCHHVRSTDILSYLDDECQMVAYKCTSYHHFKLGACETCYEPPSASAKVTAPPPVASYERNCVLVNLAEQHRDSRAVLEYAELVENELRQLAESRAVAATGGREQQQQHWPSRNAQTIDLFRRLDELERRERERKQVAVANSTTSGPGQTLTGSGEASSKARKSYYHFVSTSPNFRFGRKTHCLQHYQLRLLIYYQGSGNLTRNLQEKCKLSSYYVSSSDEIQLKMYYESGPSPTPVYVDPKAPKLVLDSGDPRQMSSSIKLSGIIKDLFHTTLVNFEGAPRLFTGAQLNNIDWSGLSRCLLREGATGRNGPNFVLDVAFMSHTNYKIRHAFSSILCGQLDLTSASTRGDNGTKANAQEEEEEELTLRLCKRSDLADVSSQIDKLLEHMRLHRLDETWKVSLLNSLFSLFTEWEPF